MNTGKDAAEFYLQQIRDCFYSLAPSDEFINAIRDDCYSFLDEHPDCSLEDLIEQFGEPESIARDYLNSVNIINPAKIAKTRRKKKIMITFLLLAILAASITAGVYLYNLYQISQGYNTQDIIIEEEN